MFMPTQGADAGPDFARRESSAATAGSSEQDGTPETLAEAVAVALALAEGGGAVPPEQPATRATAKVAVARRAARPRPWSGIARLCVSRPGRVSPTCVTCLGDDGPAAARRGRVRDHPGMTDHSTPQLRRLRTRDLSQADIEAARRVVWDAFPEGDEGFTEDDWQHGLGGMHFLLDVAGRLVAHASVVEREIHIDGRPFRTGYMEA